VNYLLHAARRYQLVLATDNASDFRGVGLKIVNPFD
jgi:hypothetical protein